MSAESTKTEQALTLGSSGVGDTQAIGRQIAKLLEDGDVVFLEGDLGAGKTQFAKGVGQGLGIGEDIISPTFNLLLEYASGRVPLYHFDLYRLQDEEDLEQIDFYYLTDASTPGIALIEWSSMFEEAMPDEGIVVSIKNAGYDGDVPDEDLQSIKRNLQIMAKGARGKAILEAIGSDDIIGRYML